MHKGDVMLLPIPSGRQLPVETLATLRRIKAQGYADGLDLASLVNAILIIWRAVNGAAGADGDIPGILVRAFVEVASGDAGDLLTYMDEIKEVAA